MDAAADAFFSRRRSELKLRAERKLGELLAETVQHQGGKPSRAARVTLRDLGVSYSDSSRWQAIAGPGTR